MQCSNGHELPGGAHFCPSCGERALPPLPPAGWYSDPEGSGQMRWWDGGRWAPVGTQSMADTASHAPVPAEDPVADTALHLPVTAAAYDAPPPRRLRTGLLAGVVAVAVVIVGGVGVAAVTLGDHGSKTSAAPDQGQRTAGRSSAAAGQTGSSGGGSSDKPVASHNTGHGFGAVKLGMNEAELRATHAVTGADWGHMASGPKGNTCWNLPLKGTSGGAVLFNPRDGLVDAINFSPKMATSKGIRIGSPWSALVRAYPDLDTSNSRANGPTVAIAKDVRYYFSAAPKQRVQRIDLGLDSEGCFD